MEDMMVYAKVAALLGGALCMAIGTIAPAIGQGMTVSKAIENIGKYPESASKISFLAYAGLAVIETSAIYALVISLVLIFLKG